MIQCLLDQVSKRNDTICSNSEYLSYKNGEKVLIKLSKFKLIEKIDKKMTSYSTKTHQIFT